MGWWLLATVGIEALVIRELGWEYDPEQRNELTYAGQLLALTRSPGTTLEAVASAGPAGWFYLDPGAGYPTAEQLRTLAALQGDAADAAESQEAAADAQGIQEPE